MAACPKNLRLLALVEEIKNAIESDDASNAATRLSLLTKITDLRDAVESPQDALLRIYAQVRHYLKFHRPSNRKNLTESISAAAERHIEGGCGTEFARDHLVTKFASLRIGDQSRGIK